MAPHLPIRAGDKIDDNKASYILKGVANRTLPRAEWTHHAHLVFATALLDAKGLPAAEAAAPDLIRRYNESVGGVNDDTQGYHYHAVLSPSYRRVSRAVCGGRNRRAGDAASRLAACVDGVSALLLLTRAAFFGRSAARLGGC